MRVVPGFAVISKCDYERCLGIKELLKMGLLDRIQISQDICMKIMIKKYGGWGYDHILINIPPLFKLLDIGEKDFKQMTVDNPRAIFG
jgi:phosphotriesterase-related protein